MRYRCDTNHTNPDGSIRHYSQWMGGQTLAKISNCLCEDGSRRTVVITGEPDSFFSIPAEVRVKNHRIKGFITTGDFGTQRDVTYFISTDQPGICGEYRTMANLMADDYLEAMPHRFKQEALAFQGYGYSEPWYCYQN